MIFENNIFIAPHHEGYAAQLLANLASELREAGAALPPCLITWEAEMRAIEEWRARCDQRRSVDKAGETR